jgi:hypothetical protein
MDELVEVKPRKRGGKRKRQLFTKSEARRLLRASKAEGVNASCVSALTARSN